MLHSIRVNGLLSFGEPATTITFEPLTVLIGKGGGGKTNILRLIGALKTNPESGCGELRAAAWRHEGAPLAEPPSLEAIVDGPDGVRLRHRIEFETSGQWLKRRKETATVASGRANGRTPAEMLEAGYERIRIHGEDGRGSRVAASMALDALENEQRERVATAVAAATGLTGRPSSLARRVRHRWQRGAGRTSPPQSELRYGRILCEIAGNEGGVTCIERPEAGLHPAGVWILTAKLRLAAENGSQTILTTQSPNLLNALEHDVGGVFAAERRDGKTKLRKLCTPEAEAARGHRPLGAAWCNLEIHQR